jgi:hypothetical protein
MVDECKYLNFFSFAKLNPIYSEQVLCMTMENFDKLIIV